LEIPKQTAQRIYKRYLGFEGFAAKPRVGDKRSLLTQEHLEFIQEIIDDDSAITPSAIQEQLHAVTGLNVGITTIHDAIAGFNYTFKRLTIRASVSLTAERIEERRNYSQWHCRQIIAHRNMVYVDEVGFQVSSRVSSGRSKAGTRACTTVPTVRSRNISVMAAITKYGRYKLNLCYKLNQLVSNSFYYRILCFQILDGNGNAEHFRQFLHQIRDSCEEHVGFHKTPIVVEEHPILDLEQAFLPTYSPFFNPIENMFSQWKNYVRRQRSEDEVQLRATINNVRNIVTVEDCQGFVAKASQNCYSCAHDGLDIFDNKIKKK
jgi:hypothetical protein